MKGARALVCAAAFGVACAAAPASAAPRWLVHHRSATRSSAADTHAASFTPDAPPLRWNACADVPWSVSPDAAPEGGAATIRAAVARVAGATGLHFVEVASTSLVADGPTVGLLLVGWSTPRRSALLAGQSPTLVGMTQELSTGPTIVGSVVVLNADLRAPTSGADSWYTFALHELGHAVGLAHTADNTQIMAPTIPPLATDYGLGDLAGLTVVGGRCGHDLLS